MATKGRSWTPAEPEPPDSQTPPIAVGTLDGGGLRDARVDRLVVLPHADASLVRAGCERVEAPGAALPGLDARDVVISGGDLSNADLAGAVLRRVRAENLGAVGVDASSARLEDAAFRSCKLRLVRGFSVRMTRCLFEDCDLREAELEGAMLDRVVFRNCDLSGARLAGADLGRCDLRGSRVDGLVVSPDRLRGVRVDATQLPTFAAALGLDLGDAPRP